MHEINFFFEDTPEITIPSEILSGWLNHVTNVEGSCIDTLNYIFCSDEHLYQINIKYLHHDYYTDVITFDNSEGSGKIEGDIFISTDRVAENAKSHNANFHEELRRICVHGLLHLLGYSDGTNEDKLLMTEKENAYLSLPQFQ